MALIKCSECNKSISDQSDECVGCGAPSHVFLKSIENPITDPVAEELTPVEEINLETDPIEEISEEEYKVNTSNLFMLETEEEKELVKEESKVSISNLFISLIAAFLTLIIVSIAAAFINEPSAIIIPPTVSYFVYRSIRKKKVKFDKKDPKYLAIKSTNVYMFITLFIVESAQLLSNGWYPNPIALYITFLITRWFIRDLYTKKSNFRNNKIYYKIGGTILIWIFVFLVKQMIGITFLNIAL